MGPNAAAQKRAYFLVVIQDRPEVKDPNSLRHNHGSLTYTERHIVAYKLMMMFFCSFIYPTIMSPLHRISTEEFCYVNHVNVTLHTSMGVAWNLFWGTPKAPLFIFSPFFPFPSLPSFFFFCPSYPSLKKSS